GDDVGNRHEDHRGDGHDPDGYSQENVGATARPCVLGQPIRSPRWIKRDWTDGIEPSPGSAQFSVEDLMAHRATHDNASSPVERKWPSPSRRSPSWAARWWRERSRRSLTLRSVMW